MAYLDSSSQDASPSFLQSLAQALGMGASPTPPTNPRALASALAGTHYAQLPGPPLLLRNDQDTAQSFGAGGAAPVAPPAPAAPMRGSVADIQAPGMAPAAVTPSSQPGAAPAVPVAAPAGNAIVVPGYEAKGPLTRAQVVAAPDDDKTMPAEEDWDQAAALKAKAVPGAAPAIQAGSAPAANQYTAAIEKEYSTAMAGHDAEMAAARSAAAGGTQAGYELAKGHLATADRYLQLATAAQAKYDETLKPGWHYASNAELSPGERASGAEYQVSPLGEHSKIAGTEGDTTRVPNAEEAARLVASGRNPNDYMFKDGMPVPVAPGKSEAKWEQTGTDIDGNPIHGWVYPPGSQAQPRAVPTPVPAAGPYGAPSTGTPHVTTPSLQDVNDAIAAGRANGLTGEKFLATIPATVADHVRAINAGDEPMPVTGFAGAKPINQVVNDAVRAAFPGTSAAEFNARLQAKKDMAPGGKDQLMIEKLNSAVGHSTDQLAEGKLLNNTGNQALNAAEDWFYPSGSQTAGHIAEFNNLGNLAGPEFQSIYVPSGGAETEREAHSKSMSATMAPQEMEAVHASRIRAVAERVAAVEHQWNDSMGPNASPWSGLTPQTLTQMQRYANDKLPDRFKAKDASGRSLEPATVNNGFNPGATQQSVQAWSPRNVAPQVTGAPPATRGKVFNYVPGQGLVPQ